MSFNLPALPAGWNYIPLETCVQPKSITYGVVQPGADLADGVPIIRVNNFLETRLELSELMKISPKVEAKYERTRLAGGEVLLTLVGSVGQVAVVPREAKGFNVARAVGVIHPLPHVSAEWIAICLRSPLSQYLLGSRANTTVQTTINLKDVRALPIPMPPLEERECISSLIMALDNRIALLRETNATLEAIAQALFKSWFVDFDPVRTKQQGLAPEGMDEATAALFPDRFEESELGVVPRGWAIGPILDISTLLSGGTPKTDRAEYWGGEILWASARDVSQSNGSVLIDTERTITQRGLEESSTRMIPALATVVVARGATTGRMVISGRSMAMNQTCYALTSKVDTPIALYCLLKQQINALVNAAHGSVFDTITTTTFAQSRVVKPDLRLLHAFEEIANPLFEKVIAGAKAAQSLEGVRDTLLPRLISGQLRLPDAEAQTEEAAA